MPCERNNCLSVYCSATITLYRINVADNNKITQDISESVQYFCSILTKLVFSWHFLKQVFNIKFHETPSSWIRADTGGGRADTRDETNILFLRVCENALINTINVILTISNTRFRIEHSPMKMKVLSYPVFPDFIQSAAFGNLRWSLYICAGKSNVS